MKCPICGEGSLTEHTTKDIIPLYYFDDNSPYGCVNTEFSVCDVCGSETVYSKQLTNNVVHLLDVRNEHTKEQFGYKGYKGTAEYSDVDGVFHGKIINTKDLVTYESQSLRSLGDSFRESVEEYIKWIKEE